MRLFAAQLLLISTAGNLLSEVLGDCGEKAEVLEERNGSIWYTFPTGLYFHNLTFGDTPGDTENITCTWIINARENQSVWIDVVHLDEDTSLRITFSNKAVQEHAKGTLVAGTGRTTVEWSWRNYTRAPELYLRWNTSEDGRDLAWVPHKPSDSDPVSPSPDTPNEATRPADILGYDSAASPSVHTLWDLRAQQGGGVSASADKNGLLVPQEGTHNGQEVAGAAISDLAHSVTHSWAERNTQSTLSYTHEKRHMVTPTLPFSKSPPRTMAGRYEVAMATRKYLNRETDSVYTDMQAIDPNKKTVTKMYPDGQNGTLLNTASVATSQTISLAESITEALALKNVPKEQASYSATERDITMTTSTDESVSLVTSNQPHATTLADALEMEMDQTSGSLRLTQPNQDLFVQTHTSIFDDSYTIPDVTHDLNNVSTFSPQNASESPLLRTREEYTHTPNTQPTLTVHSLGPTSKDILHTIQSDAQQTTLTFMPSITNQAGSTDTLDHDTHHTADPSSAVSPSVSTTPSELPLTSLTLASPSPNTVRQGREREMSSASSTLSFDVTTPWVRLTPTPDLIVQDRVTTEEPLYNTSEQESDGATFTRNTETSISETQSYIHKQQKTQTNTLGPHVFHKYATEPDTVFPQYTNIPRTESSGNDISVSLGPMIPVSISPSASGQTGSMKVAHGDTDGVIWTERNGPVTPTTPSPVISLNPVNSTGEDVSTSTPSQWGASQTPAASTPLMTTPRAKITPTASSHHLTSSQNGAVLNTHVPTEHPRTSTLASLMSTNSFQGQTGTQAPSAWTQTSSVHSVTLRTDNGWLHKGRVFIVEDQPAVIKVETFQVLLQVVLDGNSPSYVELEFSADSVNKNLPMEPTICQANSQVEPILHKVAGYQSQQVTWHSGPVLQMVVTFRTVEALPWLGRVESLLHEAGLSPLPRDGVFVGGVRVKNITIGGLHSDVCSWLFMCPSGFQCASSEGNASCRSLCHSEYCKHHGICVHRPGQQPICQCPVGEDFWFMGQRCDLRMTRQRLVGVCFGVLLAAAALMAALSYLAVRRFKSMLIQAKVDQTRSSYRRFNHFDELSARFWGRSWPGSEDSLDNPGFTRSDELLHMRALDRTCCYHDDTLSIASTYQDSVSQLNTVYPHSSQYHWDLSNYSLADCVVDSGKASDLSVCSWPIEPIQWTPFPLLQQLSRTTASVKASRPRSYCEGMELVDLEKSWTA